MGDNQIAHASIGQFVNIATAARAALSRRRAGTGVLAAGRLVGLEPRAD